MTNLSIQLSYSKLQLKKKTNKHEEHELFQFNYFNRKLRRTITRLVLIADRYIRGMEIWCQYKNMIIVSDSNHNDLIEEQMTEVWFWKLRIRKGCQRPLESSSADWRGNRERRLGFHLIRRHRLSISNRVPPPLLPLLRNPDVSTIALSQYLIFVVMPSSLNINYLSSEILMMPYLWIWYRGF